MNEGALLLPILALGLGLNGGCELHENFPALGLGLDGGWDLNGGGRLNERVIWREAVLWEGKKGEKLTTGWDAEVGVG